jgi:periplasmic mercuric ion binding protein
MRRWIVLALTSGWTAMAIAGGAPRQIVYDVKNMTCAACAITIKKALQRVPGASVVKIDGQAETVTVSLNDRTSVDAVARVISEAGFPAKPRG